MVFESLDQNKGLDNIIKGEKENQDVYVWLIEYNDGLKSQTESGEFALIR